MTQVLITGAFGQIGTELALALGERHGPERVLVSGRTLPESDHPLAGFCAQRLDVTDATALRVLIEKNRIDVIYHLAAVLSALGEQSPQRAWQVNMEGLRNVLEAARIGGVQQVFWPSSIAVFGPGSPKRAVPQDTVMRPSTMYGLTKVAGELLADYYWTRYGLDVRGVRYPGVISSGAAPGGGTTDYAVEIFYAAVAGHHYSCFVREDTVLPMIYMPDCTRAALELMEADVNQLVHHNGFNLGAMSFSAGELAKAIKRHIPDFSYSFEPDQRQAIADSWPQSIDDRAARREWGWESHYGLEEMTCEMLGALGYRA